MAGNPLGQELCGRCGTRLMLVFEPSVQRFEGGHVAEGGLEEHLLERISALENHILRLADKLEQTLDLLLKQARTSYQDHALIETVIDALSDAGSLDRKALGALWRQRRERDEAAHQNRSRCSELRARSLVAHTGRERAAFTRLVNEGFDLVQQGKTAAGVRALERAAALSPENAPLNAFLGEHFFAKGKTALARDYLARAHAADPEEGRVRLLLGLAAADEGDAEGARALLSEAVNRGGPSFAAHYALGRLAAAEGRWEAALEEFKRALAARPSPEAHYLLGLANYRLGRNRTALRHLSKAVEMDAKYGEAFYLMGLARLRAGEAELAGESFDAALASDAGEARYRAARERLSKPDQIPPPSLLTAAARGRRRLVTGGDERLAAALRDDALGGPPPR